VAEEFPEAAEVAVPVQVAVLPAVLA